MARKIRQTKTKKSGYRRRVYLSDEELEFIYASRDDSSIIIKSLKDDAKNKDNLKTIRELEKRVIDAERIAEAFENIKSTNVIPSKRTISDKKGVTAGTPCIFLSDLHHGEVVDPAQICGVNKFNIEISKKRISKVIEKSISLLFDYFSKPSYDRVVLIMGGDMVSGNIHDELRETNDEPIMEIAVGLAQILIEHIYTLKDKFEYVYVPCVVGNHGRIDKRPRAKGGVKDNFDYLIYKIIERHFAKDKHVYIDVATGFDLRFDVNGHRFLLTHGNQFKAGNALAGPVMAWKRGELKKKKNYEALGNPFDTMIMGHFHSLTYANGLIVNGCTKGMDEWCFGMNFEFERPQQALWIVGVDGKLNYKMEVYAD